MSAPVCPECGSAMLRFVNTFHGEAFAECQRPKCFWTQAPDEDLAISAALETYRRNNPPTEAA